MNRGMLDVKPPHWDQIVSRWNNTWRKFFLGNKNGQSWVKLSNTVRAAPKSAAISGCAVVCVELATDGIAVGIGPKVKLGVQGTATVSSAGPSTLPTMGMYGSCSAAFVVGGHVDVGMYGTDAAGIGAGGYTSAGAAAGWGAGCAIMFRYHW